MQHQQITEGYIFTSYGTLRYLRDVIVAVDSIRRYDSKRPVALYCSEEHIAFLKKHHLDHYFALLDILPEENRSIVGFKHFTHNFMPFDRNLFLDSDMIWCRDPERLWQFLSLFPYSITGQESADVFFGSHKGVGVISDIILRRRQKTLKTFGLTHLYRVQSGIIYAQDKEVTKQINQLATEFISRMDETHFKSRTFEKGRTLESCEWSLGMALSKLNMFVYPWFNGYESAQLDYITGFTQCNEDFSKVECLYYCNPFIYSLRGVHIFWVRSVLIFLFSILPRSGDHFWTTPYALHFGWKHEKHHFNHYAEKRWAELCGADLSSIDT